MTHTEQKQFVDYVLSFYGRDGIYPSEMTAEDVITLMNVIIDNEDDEYEEFSGDSVDREIIRDLYNAWWTYPLIQ